MPSPHPPARRPHVLPPDGAARAPAAREPSSTPAPGSRPRTRWAGDSGPRAPLGRGRPRGAPAGPRARRPCRTTPAARAAARARPPPGRASPSTRRVTTSPVGGEHLDVAEPVEAALGPHERLGGLDRPRVPDAAAQQLDRHPPRLERRGHLAGARRRHASQADARRQVQQRGREAVAAQVRGLPGRVRARRLQRAVQRPAQARAAGVALAVPAHGEDVARPARRAGPSGVRRRARRGPGAARRRGPRAGGAPPRSRPAGCRPGTRSGGGRPRARRSGAAGPGRIPSASQRVGQGGRERRVEVGCRAGPSAPTARLLEQQPAVVGHRGPRRGAPRRRRSGSSRPRAGRRSPPRR